MGKVQGNRSTLSHLITPIRMTILVVILVVVGLISWVAVTNWRARQLMGAAAAPGNAGLGSAPDPIVLTDSQEEYPLGLHMQILEDSSGTLTIEDVTSAEYGSKFVTSTLLSPTYGYTPSAYWVRLALRNEASRIEDWLLQIRYPNMHYVDLYTPSPLGAGFDVRQTGVLRPLATRDLRVPWIVFKLHIPEKSQDTIYLRFESGAAMQLPLTLWSPSAFIVFTLTQAALWGAFFGILFGLMLYNLIVLAMLRDRLYLYLAIVLGAAIMQEASFAGYTELYILPGLSAYKKYYHALALLLLFSAMILFSDEFLELKSRHPLLHRAGRAMIGCLVALGLASPWIPFYRLAAIVVISGIPALIIGVFGGVLSWRASYRAARFILVSWIGLVFAMYATLLTRLALVPSTPGSESAYRLGFVIVGSMLSIAMADRVNILRATTEEANRNLRRSEARRTQVLEAMPLGVAVYGSDMKAQYANRRLVELLRDPDRGVEADVTAGRTLANAIRHFTMKRAGSDQPYPLEESPVYKALQGQSAAADDIEMHRGEGPVPLEAWASPLMDDSGKVDAAVLVVRDISDRKQDERELLAHRQHLEDLVEARAAELSVANKELQLHLDWLNAISRVNEVVARTSDFNEVYERLGRITTGLFGSRDAFLAEWDGSSRRIKILTHSCRFNGHLVPSGSFATLPAKVFYTDSLSVPRLASLSVVWGKELASVDGPLGDHLRATQATRVALVSMPVHGQVMGFLGLEMPDETTFTTSREANLLRAYAVDTARVIENANLFEQAKTLAAIEERNRLARELHDSVAQALFGISLFTDATRMALTNRKLDVVRGHVEELAALSRQAMLDMRLLIFELRPPILATAGLASALQSRLESVEAKAGFEADFESHGEISLSPATEAEIYRIAQEALNNVSKYARANKVQVRLTQEAGVVRLLVADDGVGFDTAAAEQQGGQGFRGMRERAERIGGRLWIESMPGGGSKITLEVRQ